MSGVSGLSGNSYNNYSNFDSTINSGKLSSFADKMACISDNINALIDRLKAEQETLGGMRADLRDLRAQLADKKHEKAALKSPTAPNPENYKDGVNSEAYQKDLATFNTDKANYDSKLSSIESSINSLENKISSQEDKIAKQEDRIAKTKDEIDVKRNELDTVRAQARREQMNASSGVTGKESTVGLTSVDTEIADKAIAKAEMAKVELRSANDNFQLASANTSRSAIGSAVAAQTAGIDARDSGEMSAQLASLWNGGYSESFSQGLKSGNAATMQSVFADFMTTALTNGSITGNSMDADINAIIQQVLRESYMDTNQDLKYYAAKVKSFNEQKKVARNALQEMRQEKTSQMDEMRKANPEAKFEEFGLTKNSIEEMKYEANPEFPKNDTRPYLNKDGDPVADKKDAALSDFGKLCQDYQLKMDDVNNGQKLDDAIQTMEETLSSIGDDAQLANTDLQNVMQKQQQYIQMMSNVSKMVHDTAMAIIRKIG